MKDRTIKVKFGHLNSLTTDALYQYDTGQQIEFNDEFKPGTEVQFEHNGTTINTNIFDGKCYIPDEVLTRSGNVIAWIQVIGDDSTTTVKKMIIPVTARPNASDTVAPEHQPTFKEEVQKMVDAAENAADRSETAMDEADAAAGRSEAAMEAAGKAAIDAQDSAAEAEDSAAEAERCLEELKTGIKNGDFKGEPGYTPIKGVDYFDGKKGDPGYTPQKNVDYFDGEPGKDYVLTEYDKRQIAEMARPEDYDQYKNKTDNTALDKVGYSEVVDGALYLYSDEKKTKLIGEVDVNAIIRSGKAGSADDADKVNGHTVDTDVPEDAKFTDTQKYFVIHEDDCIVETDSAKGEAPYSSSYGYTNITIKKEAGVEWIEGGMYAFVIDTKLVVGSSYRNVRVRTEGEDVWHPVMGYASTIASGSTYFVKAMTVYFQYKRVYQSVGALHAALDNNTTYAYLVNTVPTGAVKIDNKGYGARYSYAFATTPLGSTDERYSSLVSSSSSGSTKKTNTIEKYYIDRKPLYIYSANVAAGAVTGNVLYQNFTGMDIRYTANTTTSFCSVNRKAYLWLKDFDPADMSFKSDATVGNIMTDDKIATRFPSTTDGYVYLLFLGWVSSTWYTLTPNFGDTIIVKYNPSTGKGTLFDAAEASQERITPISNSVDTATVYETVGCPEYIQDSDLQKYRSFGITESGWYLFAQVKAKNGEVVTTGYSVTGAAGFITPEIGNDHVDIAVKFGVIAESQKVTINWGRSTETFVFKSTDLAIRNLDYRVTFYLYNIDDYCEWEYELTSDTKFIKDKGYYKLINGRYVIQEVVADADVPANTYYCHKSLTIKDFTRNMSYTLDTTVDCPVTIHLPEVGGDNYGAWFEVQMNFLGTYSVTIIPHDGQKVSANGVHSPKVGINIINILYHKPTNTWLPTVTNWKVSES